MSETSLEHLTRSLKEKWDRTITRTPAPGCPSCEANRLHTAEDWKQFHPDAGTGTHKEHGTALAQPTAPAVPSPALHDKEKP